MNTCVTFALRALLLGASLIAALQSDPKPSPPPQPRPAKIEGLYAGPWVTTNRKLDGVLNCRVKQIEPEHWQGRFWGVWQHVPLDYTVEFCGDPIVGTATIDGAHYDWTGTLTEDEFDIQFTGSRYEGHLELKRVETPLP